MSHPIHRSPAGPKNAIGHGLRRIVDVLRPVLHLIGRHKWVMIGLVAAVVVIALITWPDPDRHASPPEVAAHLPGNTANAPANQTQGTCRVITSDQVSAAFAGTASPGQADNLTPGLDRCNWSITKSKISPSLITLAAIRPLAASAAPSPGSSAARPSDRQAQQVLGTDATYDPATHTLTYTSHGQPLTLQLLIPHGVKTDPKAVETDLIALAKAATT